ncbi:hypothetical protein GCM10009535_21070 [Streptomyces thermocarboxydovorans]|uniref:Uncharacterized protein n=1 Tax=Streptomyces thermocarboxydovorans TaxID=59298 RepID=A0ABP3SJK4_9ACTN
MRPGSATVERATKPSPRLGPADTDLSRPVPTTSTARRATLPRPPGGVRMLEWDIPVPENQSIM